MPIMEGWEVSSDRMKKYQKMLSAEQIGDPIITSKCYLKNDPGFIIASHNGYAWRIQMTAARHAPGKAGKSKWVRWHDVAQIRETKPGQIIVENKVRKNALLKVDKYGYPKTKKWKLTIKPSKGEPKANFKQRKQYFFNIMSELHIRNKGVTDPPTSDSRM